MKLTIITDDGFVSKDGVGYSGLALQIPEGIHAVQWYDTYGEVEYKPVSNNGSVEKQANEVIFDMAQFEYALSEWTKADDMVKSAAVELELEQQNTNTPVQQYKT